MPFWHVAAAPQQTSLLARAVRLGRLPWLISGALSFLVAGPCGQGPVAVRLAVGNRERRSSDRPDSRHLRQIYIEIGVQRTAFQGFDRPARRLVEEIGQCRPCKNVQAGGRCQAKREAPDSRRRLANNVFAAGEARARKLAPGRSMTAIGSIRAMARHRRQWWKVARLSAPISHTKRQRGACLCSRRTVS